MADDSNGGRGFSAGGYTPVSGAQIGDGQNANRARMLGTQMGQTPAYRQNFGYADETRNAQMDAMGLARDAARGNAPSRAELLGKQMIGDSLNAQLASAASTRGGPMAQAAAQRQAAQGAAAFQQSGANNIAAMRAGEMADARSAYAQQAGAVRTGDLGQVGMQTQNDQFQRGLNAQQQLGYEQMANGLDVQQAQMGQQNQQFNAQLGQQNNQFNAGLAQQQDQFGRTLSNQHWSQQAGLNQHAVDRETGLWTTLGGGLLSGAGGALAGVLAKSDPRSKMNMRDMSMGGGSAGPWMPPDPSDVNYIKYGPNADPSALDDRYAQNGAPPAPWLDQYMPSQAPTPSAYASGTPGFSSSSGYRAARGNAMGGDMFSSGYEGDNDWSKPSTFGGPPQKDAPVLAPGTDDYNATGGDATANEPDWTNGGATTKGESSGELGGAISGGLKDLGGGLSRYGANLVKSDPRSKMGIMPMNSVDPATGTVQLHGGGMSSGDLLAAGTGLAGPQPVAGMVGGGGITGGSVNTAGRGSDGTVDLSISDPQAKREMFRLGAEYATKNLTGKDLEPWESDDDVSTPTATRDNHAPSGPHPLPDAPSFAPSGPHPLPESRRPADRGSKGLATEPLDMGRMLGDAQAGRPEYDPQAAAPARMMDAIGGGKAFQYKPGVAGEDPSKQHFGTTTEDLKKTPMGASMVVPGGPLTDGFEAINTKEAVGPMLASLGNLNQRLRMLEMGGGNKKAGR